MIHGHEYFNIEIETENDLFKDGKGFEIAMVLRQLANRIETLKVEEGDEYALQDSNGNTVGTAKAITYKDSNFNARHLY